MRFGYVLARMCSTCTDMMLGRSGVWECITARHLGPPCSKRSRSFEAARRTRGLAGSRGLRPFAVGRDADMFDDPHSARPVAAAVTSGYIFVEILAAISRVSAAGDVELP